MEKPRIAFFVNGQSQLAEKSAAIIRATRNMEKFRLPCLTIRCRFAKYALSLLDV